MARWLDSKPQWLWAVLTALAAWALAVFAAAPSLYHFELAKIHGLRPGDYLNQCANPLARSLGATQLAYRVFVPTVAWLIGARLWLALALPYFATLGMLTAIAFILGGRYGRPMGTVATMLAATSYAVTWPDCMLGYGDSAAHLFGACLLAARRPWLIGLLVAAGLLTDERFILELPLVVLWHSNLADSDGKASWVREAWRPVAAALGGYLVFRHALTVGWIGAGVPSAKAYGEIREAIVTFHPHGLGWGAWWVNVFAGLRWCWVLILAALVCRWRLGSRADAVALGLILAGSAASTIVVFDVSRSIGFSYLAIPLALAWLIDAAPKAARRLGSWAVWACYLTPSFLMIPGCVIWWRPLPLRLYAFLTGHDPLAWQSFVY